MEVIPIFHKSVASDFPIPGIIVNSLMVCSLVIASDELHDKVALIVNLPKRIVGYLEHIAVQILEMAAVTAQNTFAQALQWLPLTRSASCITSIDFFLRLWHYKLIVMPEKDAC